MVISEWKTWFLKSKSLILHVSNYLIINMNNQIVLELPIVSEFYNFYIQIIIISFF
jgi:hypothetical protein